MQRLISFLKCESGAQAVEYAIIGGIGAASVVWAMDAYKIEMQAVWTHLGKTMESWGELF